jgi:hypothetical protein
MRADSYAGHYGKRFCVEGHKKKIEVAIEDNSGESPKETKGGILK